jgi:hypothetical protein
VQKTAKLVLSLEHSPSKGSLHVDICALDVLQETTVVCVVDDAADQASDPIEAYHLLKQ